MAISLKIKLGVHHRTGSDGTANRGSGKSGDKRIAHSSHPADRGAVSKSLPSVEVASVACREGREGFCRRGSFFSNDGTRPHV